MSRSNIASRGKSHRFACAELRDADVRYAREALARIRLTVAGADAPDLAVACAGLLSEDAMSAVPSRVAHAVSRIAEKAVIAFVARHA